MAKVKVQQPGWIVVPAVICRFLTWTKLWSAWPINWSSGLSPITDIKHLHLVT